MFSDSPLFLALFTNFWPKFNKQSEKVNFFKKFKKNCFTVFFKHFYTELGLANIFNNKVTLNSILT